MVQLFALNKGIASLGDSLLGVGLTTFSETLRTALPRILSIGLGLDLDEVGRLDHAARRTLLLSTILLVGLEVDVLLASKPELLGVSIELRVARNLHNPLVPSGLHAHPRSHLSRTLLLELLRSLIVLAINHENVFFEVLLRPVKHAVLVLLQLINQILRFLRFLWRVMGGLQLLASSRLVLTM